MTTTQIVIIGSLDRNFLSRAEVESKLGAHFALHRSADLTGWDVVVELGSEAEARLLCTLVKEQTKWSAEILANPKYSIAMQILDHDKGWIKRAVRRISQNPVLLIDAVTNILPAIRNKEESKYNHEHTPARRIRHHGQVRYPDAPSKHARSFHRFESDVPRSRGSRPY